MSAITISREIGSRGSFIAEQVAKRLNYALVDKNTIERVFLQYGFADFKETYDQSGFWARFDPHRSELEGLLNKVIEAMVAHGDVVIVGRGGFAVLRDFDDVLNVRIQAPLLVRVRRVAQEQDITDLAKVEMFVREGDKMRQEFVETAYGKQWDSVSAFDLVIDTGKVTPEAAVNWLVETARNLPQGTGESVRSVRELEIDSVLAQTVAEVLDAKAADKA